MPGVPATGGLARAGGVREGRALRRSGVLGQAGAGVRRSTGASVDPRSRAGGARRESHRPDLHRRSFGRLPVRVAPSVRRCQPGDVGRARRWSPADLRLHQRGEPLRAAGEQADAAGARHLHAVPRTGDRGARAVACDRGARRVRVGRRAAGARRAGSPDASEAALRPCGGGRGRPVRAGGLLPPQPAEHVHRQAHAGRCSTTCSRVRWTWRDVVAFDRGRVRRYRAAGRHGKG